MNDQGLEVDRVVVRYGRATAVERGTLAVPPGQVSALVGPNGAGKSSLLGAIAGVLKVDAGSIRLDGRDLDGMSPAQRAVAGVVLVPQGRQLFPRLSVVDNLRVVADALRLPPGAVEAGLDRFSILRERSHSPAGVLSGGEQQMLALARGLMSEPRVLLLDEPTTGLAPAIVAELMTVARSLASAGVAVLIAEPSLQLLGKFVDGGSVILRGHVHTAAATSAGLAEEYRQRMGLEGAMPTSDTL